MPDTITCPVCKGQGTFEALVNQHDDKKETVKCYNCHDKGVIHQMTDEEERDYWENYW